MKHESIDGLVIGAMKSGENDAYLTVLTKEKGRIGILSKGARSLKGGKHAVSQPFTLANFEYYTRGEVNILKDGSVLRSFFDLSGTTDGSTLAFYLCELAYELSDAGEEAEDLLRLLLNSLHVLANGLYPETVVKAVFELRAMAISGYEPQISKCSECGSANAHSFYLNVEGGTLICADCLRETKTVRPSDYDDVRTAGTLLPISPATLGALRYCISGPLSRIFSFSLEDGADFDSLCRIAESYVLSHLERSFGTLEFYLNSKEDPEKLITAYIKGAKQET